MMLKSPSIKNLKSRAEFSEKTLMEAVKNNNLAAFEILIETPDNLNEKDIYDNTVLMLASEEGHLEMVNLLLQKGADVNAENEHQQTALLKAAENNQQEVVKLLLEKGANPNRLTSYNKHIHDSIEENECAKLIKDSFIEKTSENLEESNLLRLMQYGNPLKYNVDDLHHRMGITKEPLLIAALSGNIKMLQFFIRNGADVNKKDQDDRTALLYASMKGDINTVKFLCDNGADTNTCNSRGMTALMFASTIGHLQLVNTLLSYGADSTAKNINGYTASMMAGSDRVIAGTLQNAIAAKTNKSVAKIDKTSLILAVVQNDYKKVEELLSNENIDINYITKTTKGSFTALAQAAQRGLIDIVELLLKDKKIDVNEPYNNGNTPLIESLIHNHLKIATKLIENKANVNIADADGLSPLIIAISRKFLDIAKLLIDAGANLNYKRNGFTPLTFAISKRQEDIALHILKKNNSTNLVNTKEGYSAWALAASAGQVKVIQALLGKGFTVNYADKDGYTDEDGFTASSYTALMLASGGEHTDLVKFLLQEGANVNIVSKDGFTAADLAKTDEIRALIMQDKAESTAAPMPVDSNNNDVITSAKNDETPTENARDSLPVLVEEKVSSAESKAISQDSTPDSKTLNFIPKDYRDYEPLRIAIREESLETIKELLPKDNVNILLGSLKQHILTIAAQKGRIDVVEYLVKNGANINPDELAGIPLLDAIHYKHDEVAAYLIENGAKISNDCLMSAVTKDCQKALELLLNKGLDVNHKNKIGSTILMIAAQNENEDMIKIILDAGAKTDIVNNKGKTAADLAGSNEIRALITQYKAENTAISMPTEENALDKKMPADSNQETKILTAKTLVNNPFSDSELYKRTFIKEISNEVIDLKENAKLFSSSEITSLKDIFEEIEHYNTTKMIELKLKDNSYQVIDLKTNTSFSEITSPKDLFEAMDHNNATKVNELISQNSSLVNATNKDGSSALLMAIAFGHNQIANNLLINGAHAPEYQKEEPAVENSWIFDPLKKYLQFDIFELNHFENFELNPSPSPQFEQEQSNSYLLGVSALLCIGLHNSIGN